MNVVFPYVSLLSDCYGLQDFPATKFEFSTVEKLAPSVGVAIVLLAVASSAASVLLLCKTRCR